MFGLPSALLYLAECYVIFVNRKRLRASSFFNLFLLRSIPSLINFVSAYAGGHRFGRAGWFLSFYKLVPTQILVIPFFIGYWAFHAENFASAFMLLNRLSSVFMPLAHVRMWRNFLFPISVIVTVGAPAIICHRILFLDVFIRVQADNSTFTLDYFTRNTNFEDMAWDGGDFWAAVFGIIFLFICTFLNLTTIFAYHRQRRQYESGQQTTNHIARLEWKLTVYALATFLTQLLMCVYQIVIWACVIIGASTTKLFLTTFNQSPWINDLSTIAVPAWLMLWASTMVRTLVAEMFFENTFVVWVTSRATTNLSDKSTTPISIRLRSSQALTQSVM
ncbi:srg family chemoreceptor domain-containing protein [Ditylenchus destructor]|uniref:Serpentine receptor class gamma n=1 Tax=Ditylenchus destructor TaxID=166010 RepID=A0AAD4MVM1_9BILA|nr:srg family chemoreceptor domain-containing protein [Ditylenchus destructor]